MNEITVDTRDGICPVPAEIKVDCRGETCPVPLVEARKALRKANPGDIVAITGTHAASKKEIPMAVEALGLELLGIDEQDGQWTIRIRR
ncbi:MAG: sulfurtransferase TusA family protein [Chloroflexi bacterium]|nr:sulfurtransferase TusA family protein [Chloroflexota bacterium]MBU1750582.1 sulfurtransferase TusA family protein [Chloroflexota bacterium]